MFTMKSSGICRAYYGYFLAPPLTTICPNWLTEKVATTQAVGSRGGSLSPRFGDEDEDHQPRRQGTCVVRVHLIYIGWITASW